MAYETSTGFNNFGKPTKYRSAQSAGCSILPVLVSPDNMTSDENEMFQIYSTGQYSDRYIWKAFDGDLSTFCDARGSTGPRYFGWRRKDGKRNSCTFYEIYNISSGATADNMCEWSLQGSNDGETYTEIHHVSNYTSWEGNGMAKFKVNSNEFYSYFKIICLKSGDNYSNTEYVPYIKEFKMYGYLK